MITAQDKQAYACASVSVDCTWLADARNDKKQVSGWRKHMLKTWKLYHMISAVRGVVYTAA